MSSSRQTTGPAAIRNSPGSTALVGFLHRQVRTLLQQGGGTDAVLPGERIEP